MNDHLLSSHELHPPDSLRLLTRALLLPSFPQAPRCHIHCFQTTCFPKKLFGPPGRSGLSTVDLEQTPPHRHAFGLSLLLPPCIARSCSAVSRPFRPGQASAPEVLFPAAVRGDPSPILCVVTPLVFCNTYFFSPFPNLCMPSASASFFSRTVGVASGFSFSIPYAALFFEGMESLCGYSACSNLSLWPGFLFPPKCVFLDLIFLFSIRYVR